MKSLHSLAFAVASGLLLGACAHPFLAAGGKYAAGVEKGNATLSTLMDSEAQVFRRRTALAKASPAFKVKSADDLNSGFVGLVCRPHSPQFVSERIAIINLEQFRTAIATNATDPKDPTLASLVISLTDDAARFNPTAVDKAVEEYKSKKSQQLDACLKDVRTTFVYTPESGALTIAGALAAWPKIKDFLNLLAGEANKARRERAIIDMLRSDYDAISKSIDLLSTSVSSGGLYNLSTQQRQLALWTAYSHFLAIDGNVQRIEQLIGNSGTPAIDDFRILDEETSKMAAAMRIYDDLTSVDLPGVAKSLKDSTLKLHEAAVKGKAPEASTLADILAALDFLSSAAEKYKAAEDKL